MKKCQKSIHILLVFLFSLFLAACQSQSESTKDNSLITVQKSGKLVVATETGFAPFAFKTLVDGKNTIVGSDVDMVKKIAEGLGVEVELKEMSFDNVLVAVQSGKADIGISGISITKERQKNFEFSKGYYTAKTKIIIQKSDKDKVTSLTHLIDESVAAQKGSIQEMIVTDQIPEAHLVSLPETGEMVIELKQGKVKAVMLEEPIAKAYVEKNPDLTIADIELAPVDADTYGIILPKGNKDLAEAINEQLEPMIASGEIDQMIQDNYNLSVQE
ncbi:transporter substrate-binding domain-containing protein [Streptococcus porci]|uniref:transporter substrate-binding domain-containing protein n=1 Tax=Streptococcus porci TaxID=502567 RepID=UPI0004052294|nr:transporter substrate-binding domain-containing protein [Streptococcus porci]